MWEVKLTHDVATDGYLMVIKHSSNGVKSFYKFGEGGRLIGHEVREGYTIPNDFIFHLPFELVPMFVKAFSEIGVKPPNESYLAGELTATKKHLEDLRKLVIGGD